MESQKKNPEDLFLLIRSLSLTEKRVFTAQSKVRVKTGTKYLKLFDALWELKAYDETSFLASAAGREFKKGYAQQKNELYEKVLQVLRGLRQSDGVDKPKEFQIREMLEDARILKDRNLLGQSGLRLQQAEEDAVKYEFHELRLEILRQQRSAIVKDVISGESPELDALYGEIDRTLAVIQNKVRMLYIYDRFLLEAKRHAQLSGVVDQEELDRLMAVAELKDVGLCLSFEAKCFFYFCHAQYWHLQGKVSKAWECMRENYLLWRGSPDMQEIKWVEYRNVVNNYLIFCNEAMRYEDFDVALAEMCREARSDEEAVAMLHNSMYVRLQRYLNCCEWERALEVEQEFHRSKEKLSDHLPRSRVLAFYLSMGRLHLALEDWTRVLRWSKWILNEEAQDLAVGTVSQARLQEMIALYELWMAGDEDRLDELEKRYRSALRVFQQLENGGVLQGRVLHTVYHLARKRTDEQRRHELETLYKVLEREEARRDPSMRIIQAWVRSRLKGKRVSEVLEEVRDGHLAVLRAEVQGG